MRVYLPELVVPGKRLGRHVDHDPRSLRFLLPDKAVEKSVEWERHIPILDQGQVGSCTGNAMTGALGSGPLWDALADAVRTLLDETFATTVYSDAEKLDGGAGLPGEDQGSSGLSVAKVAATGIIDRGAMTGALISGYQHALTLAAAHNAIQAGPFITGTYWYSSMDDPTTEGIVAASGTIRGGHEYLCRQYDAARDLWWMDNSWSTSWGVQGRFAYDSGTFTKLLAGQGDVTSLVPVNEPKPTPTPTPAPPVTTDPAVQRFLTASVGADSTVLGWAQKRHYREAGDVAHQIRTLGQVAGITR